MAIGRNEPFIARLRVSGSIIGSTIRAVISEMTVLTDWQDDEEWKPAE